MHNASLEVRSDLLCFESMLKLQSHALPSPKRVEGIAESTSLSAFSANPLAIGREPVILMADEVKAMGFERALIEEITGLERELEADPRFQKLRVLRAALVHYQPSAPLEDEMKARPQRTRSSDGDASESEQRPVRRGGRQRDPERQKMLDAAVEYISAHPGRPDTGLIYSHLVELGFSIGGQNPQGNLSAALFKDGRLISHGRGGGWSIKAQRPNGSAPEDWLEENEPNDAGASNGSDAGPDETPKEGFFG